MILYRHLQHYNGTIITAQEDFFNKIFTRIRKGYSRFACERELETEQNWNILTPTLMAVNVVSFSFSWCSTGGLEVHSAGCWLSLLHLISNFSGPQTPSGFPRAPSAGCGFPNHISSTTPPPTVTATATWLLSWLSYTIVQRPLNRPLYLWNGMIDRHPAEITVMQFTGHSLPVHQSMSLSWALPCPISSAKSTHAISFDYWPLECVTSFRCITL